MTAPISLFDRVKAKLVQDAIDIGGAQTAADGAAQGVVDSRSDLVNFFDGLSGLWTRGDSQQTIADQAAVVAALSAAVAALQTTQNNQNNAGNSVFVDFSLRTVDTSNLGADFTQTYSGSGVGTLGITSGKAAWQRGFSTSRSCVAVYNAKQTLTDYQMVGVAAASKPMWFNSSTKGVNYLYARMNSGGTSYIYAAFDAFNLELGCVVAGTKTVFASFAAFAYKSTGVYWLRCGTTGGARVFQVLEGNTPVLTHTEIGTTSQMGATYRYTGMGMSAYESGLAYDFPGKIGAFAFSDNTPATTVGSYARVFRANTADTAASSAAAGDRPLPADTFDTIDRRTDDITFTAATNRFTVATAGTYMFQFRVSSDNTFTSTGVAPTCLIDGVTFTHGRAHTWADIGDGIALKVISDTFIVYLGAGQTVEPGFWHGNAVACDFQGSGDGFDTWMTIARIPIS